MGQRVGSCTCRSQACLRDKHTLQGRRKTTADLHIISARCPSNWLIFVPDILLKWSFECFHAPSILVVCTSTSWRVFALIYVFLKVYLCVTVHPYVIERAIRWPSIAVNGASTFHMSLYYWKECILCPISNWIQYLSRPFQLSISEWIFFYSISSIISTFSYF